MRPYRRWSAWLAVLLILVTGSHRLIEGGSQVNQSPGKQTCNYGPHATDSCSSSNPCNFICLDGYSKSGTSCVCKSPKVECNGKCQAASVGCSTAGAQRRNIKTRGTSKCRKGFTACGVRGSRIALEDYECVDTLYDVQSCKHNHSSWDHPS